MTDYKFGDVVLIPFPFTNQTTTKRRPAVVVSSTTYHRNHPDLILMAITGQIRPSPILRRNDRGSMGNGRPYQAVLHKTHLRHGRKRNRYQEDGEAC